jgi:hypothetical protein
MIPYSSFLHLVFFYSPPYTHPLYPPLEQIYSKSPIFYMFKRGKFLRGGGAPSLLNSPLQPSIIPGYAVTQAGEGPGVRFAIRYKCVPNFFVDIGKWLWYYFNAL